MATRLLVLLALGSATTVTAQEPAQELVRELMSPFCPGKVLSDCPSPQASEWRVDIHRWSEEGVSEREIVSRLQARVPGFDLARRPPPESSTVVPIVAFLAASTILVLAARRLVARSAPAAPAPRAAGDGYDERLDDELARLD